MTSTPAGIAENSALRQEKFPARGIFTAGQRSGRTGPQVHAVRLASDPFPPATGTKATITSGTTSNDKGRTGPLVGGRTEHLPRLAGFLRASPGHTQDLRRTGWATQPLPGTHSSVPALQQVPLTGITERKGTTHPSHGSQGLPALLASPLVLNPGK